jgi:hypothetical protein
MLSPATREANRRMARVSRKLSSIVGVPQIITMRGITGHRYGQFSRVDPLYRLKRIGRHSATGKKKQSKFIRALEYLSGGSQKRSVGIALIEGLWHKEHPYYRAVLPALTSQTAYFPLVTKSKGLYQSHTFSRIINLLLSAPYDADFEATSFKSSKRYAIASRRRCPAE